MFFPFLCPTKFTLRETIFFVAGEKEREIRKTFFLHASMHGVYSSSFALEFIAPPPRKKKKKNEKSSAATWSKSKIARIYVKICNYYLEFSLKNRNRGFFQNKSRKGGSEISRIRDFL